MGRGRAVSFGGRMTNRELELGGSKGSDSILWPEEIARIGAREYPEIVAIRAA